MHPDKHNAILASRLNSYGQNLLARFGERVHKIALDAGFTCPNRDGTKGTGGCTFCNNVSFSPASGSRQAVSEQIDQARDKIYRRTRARKFIAYFQAYTNTYADVAELETMYRHALESRISWASRSAPGRIAYHSQCCVFSTGYALKVMRYGLNWGCSLHSTNPWCG